MSKVIPVCVIAAYLLIPCRIRRLWSLGASTGTLGLAAALNGEGWGAFRYARLVPSTGDGSYPWTWDG